MLGGGRGLHGGDMAVRSRLASSPPDRAARVGLTAGLPSLLPLPVPSPKLYSRPHGLASMATCHIGFGEHGARGKREGWDLPGSCCQAASPGLSLAEAGAPQGPPWSSREALGATGDGKGSGSSGAPGPPPSHRKLHLPRCPCWAHLRHALHVQLHQFHLVHLQQGEAHPEHNLQALQRQW